MKILFALNLLLINSCSLFGIQTEEGPKYKVIKKQGPKEIRLYESYITASVTVKGNLEKAGEKGFKILAAYIFGDNEREEKMSMTSPVTQKRETIEMTSPIMQKKNESTYTMSFVMPSKYKLKDLPKTEDKRIRFDEIKPKYVATFKYSGFRTREKNEENAKLLLKWIKEKTHYKVASDMYSAGYNPPWTIPFLRRNEVMIDLTKSLD